MSTNTLKDRKALRQQRKANHRAISEYLKARIAEDVAANREYYIIERIVRWVAVGVSFGPALTVLAYVSEPMMPLPLFVAPALAFGAYTLLYFDKSTYLHRLREGDTGSSQG